MHLPENCGYIHFSDNDPMDKIMFQHQTDVLTEQVTYAIYRKIAFTDLKYLLQKPVGFETMLAPIQIQGRTIKAWFLKTHTGFSLGSANSMENMFYTINESGLIQRKKIYE